MRILLLVALLLATASCAEPPQQQANAGASFPPGSVDYRPLGLIWLRQLEQPMLPSGRLKLSNFSYDTARVQAVVTKGRDCPASPGKTASDFTLPLNGTRVINPPPGADVCWRRALPAQAVQGTHPARPWTEWNRAFTASGRIIDTRL